MLPQLCIVAALFCFQLLWPNNECAHASGKISQTSFGAVIASEENICDSNVVMYIAACDCDYPQIFSLQLVTSPELTLLFITFYIFKNSFYCFFLLLHVFLILSQVARFLRTSIRKAQQPLKVRCMKSRHYLG